MKNYSLDENSFLSDSHIHTKYSPDADKFATFEAYIKEAKKRKVKQITFTDHHDIDAAHPLFHKAINFDEYIKEFQKIKVDKDLNIRLGVEVGFQKHVVEETKDFLNKYPFDFVILSIHYIEKKDLYTQEYFQGKTQTQAYQIYFETLLEAVQTMDEFDVVGHFDYITRYSPYGDYSYDDYHDIVDQILKVLIQKNKGIEINTSGFTTENRMYPKKEIIDRFIELGGTNISIGSDAHRVSDLQRNFTNIKKAFR